MEQKLYRLLESLNIEYRVYEHEAVYTMEGAAAVDAALPGQPTKNVLVKDKKTKEFYLVILLGDRKLKESDFKEQAGWTRIRFAGEEDLAELLETTPGSVSPLELVSERASGITVVVDREISALAEDELLTFHPCRNTASLVMTRKDFFRFLDAVGNKTAF